jgi:hypothetical protein
MFLVLIFSFRLNILKNRKEFPLKKKDMELLVVLAFGFLAGIGFRYFFVENQEVTIMDNENSSRNWIDSDLKDLSEQLDKISTSFKENRLYFVKSIDSLIAKIDTDIKLMQDNGFAPDSSTLNNYCISLAKLKDRFCSLF